MSPLRFLKIQKIIEPSFNVKKVEIRLIIKTFFLNQCFINKIFLITFLILVVFGNFCVKIQVSYTKKFLRLWTFLIFGHFIYTFLYYFLIKKACNVCVFIFHSTISDLTHSSSPPKCFFDLAWHFYIVKSQISLRSVTKICRPTYLRVALRIIWMPPQYWEKLKKVKQFPKYNKGWGGSEKKINIHKSAPSGYLVKKMTDPLTLFTLGGHMAPLVKIAPKQKIGTGFWGF